MSCVDRSHLTEIARYDKVDEILLHSIRSGNHQLYEWGPSFDLRRHSHPPASLSVSSRLSAHRDISAGRSRQQHILDVFWSLLTLTTSQINVLMLITDKSMDLLRVGRLLIRIPFVRFPLEPIRVQVSGLYFIFLYQKVTKLKLFFRAVVKNWREEKKGIFIFSSQFPV